jgi:hypothetical protein
LFLFTITLVVPGFCRDLYADHMGLLHLPRHVTRRSALALRFADPFLLKSANKFQGEDKIRIPC